MFHTAELIAEIANSYGYKNLVDSGVPVKTYPNDKHNYRYIRYDGIKLLFYWSKRYKQPDGRWKYNTYVKAIVDLPGLAGKHSRLDLAVEDDVPVIVEQFERKRRQINLELMQKYRLDLPELDAWKISRVDYCVNIQVPVGQSETYIKLLRKGYDPVYRLDDDLKHETIRYYPRDGSLWIQGNSYGINFYDKHSQLIRKREAGKSVSDDDIERAQTVIRLEVQIKENGIRAIAKKNQFRTTLYGKEFLPLFLRDDIAKSMILKYLEKVAHTADYCKMAVAKKKIDSFRATGRTKEVLKQLLNSVSKGGENEARAEFGKQASKLFNLLESIGVNPVTVPKDTVGLTRSEGLPSLYRLFQEQIKIADTEHGEYAEQLRAKYALHIDGPFFGYVCNGCYKDGKEYQSCDSCDVIWFHCGHWNEACKRELDMGCEE